MLLLHFSSLTDLWDRLIDIWCFVFQAFFEPKQWDYLVEQFKQEFCRLYGMNPEPLLNIFLQAGLSSLKTPYPLLVNLLLTSLPLCLSLPLSHTQPVLFDTICVTVVKYFRTENERRWFLSLSRMISYILWWQITSKTESKEKWGFEFKLDHFSSLWRIWWYKQFSKFFLVAVCLAPLSQTTRLCCHCLICYSSVCFLPWPFLDTVMRMIAPGKIHCHRRVSGSWQFRCLTQSSTTQRLFVT